MCVADHDTMVTVWTRNDLVTPISCHDMVPHLEGILLLMEPVHSVPPMQLNTRMALRHGTDPNPNIAQRKSVIFASVLRTTHWIFSFDVCYLGIGGRSGFIWSSGRWPSQTSMARKQKMFFYDQEETFVLSVPFCNTGAANGARFFELTTPN